MHRPRAASKAVVAAPRSVRAATWARAAALAAHVRARAPTSIPAGIWAPGVRTAASFAAEPALRAQVAAPGPEPEQQPRQALLGPVGATVVIGGVTASAAAGAGARASASALRPPITATAMTTITAGAPAMAMPTVRVHRTWATAHPTAAAIAATPGTPMATITIIQAMPMRPRSGSAS